MLRGDVAADEAVSLGSISLSATSPRARERVYGYAISDNATPTSKFKFKYLLFYYANKMAAETKVKLISNRKLNFRQCTRYRQTHGNSNYYGQLKSIDNSGNYSRSTTIATAIRNSRSSPTTSDGRVNQPTTIEADNQRWSPTINDEYASTTYDDRKSAYLLAIRSLAFTFKMADKIDSQITIDK